MVVHVAHARLQIKLFTFLPRVGSLHASATILLHRQLSDPLQRNSLGWDGHSLETLGDCFVGAVDDTPPPSQPQSGAAADAATAAVADEHQQRPPEFSSIGDEGSDDGGDGRVESRGEGPSAAATGTLDLHYAGAGIVGSWDIRRVQSGVSSALMGR